jgi:hypothetical protein
MEKVTVAKWMRGFRFLDTRKKMYQLTFTSPAGKETLKDIAKFCRANESTWHPDARVHAVLEGRREVFLRILNHLRLNEDQLMEMYSGFEKPTTEEFRNA